MSYIDYVFFFSPFIIITLPALIPIIALSIKDKVKAKKTIKEKINQKVIRKVTLEELVKKEYVPTLELPNKIKIEFPKGQEPKIIYYKDTKDTINSKCNKDNLKYLRTHSTKSNGVLNFLGCYNFSDIKKDGPKADVGSIITNTSDGIHYKSYVYYNDEWNELGDNRYYDGFTIKKGYYDLNDNKVNFILQSNDGTKIMKAPIDASYIINAYNSCHNDNYGYNISNWHYEVNHYGANTCFKV